MKPKSTLRSFLLLAGSSLLTMSLSQAATFYWDNNGTAAGFGSAGGTWAQNSTSGGTSARWKTDVTGVAAGSATQATTDADVFNFGTATSGLGAGTITVSGSVTMGDTFYGAASGAIVLSGGTAINFGAAKTITVNNASNTINTVIGGAATSLTKAGSGTLVLTGANTYTGTTIINGGTINLGNSGATGSLASTALTLGGGTFSHTRTGTNAQSFTSGTTINAGASTVTTDNASNTIDLGGLTRTTPGGVLSISATGTITTTTANTNGILGGWAVLDNAGSVTDWAFSPGSGSDITGGVTYTQTVADMTAAAALDKNLDVAGSHTMSQVINANSLRFNAAAANTITLATGVNTNTLLSGGILVTNTTGNAPSITGGTLAGSASGDLIVHQYQTTNGLTIDSQIVDNVGATALTKAGPGLLTLNGTNTFTGGVFIHAGRIALGNAGAFNATPNNVTFGVGSTGTLSLGGNNLTIPVLNTNATSAGTTVIENASATNATLSINSTSNSTFAGVIQNGTGAGTLALTKAGTGTLTLSGANTYSGGTTLSAGTVAISNATALGAGSVSVTGNSRINAAALTYANDISIDATRVLTLGTTGAANSTSTFSGAITGDGSITLEKGVNSGTVVNLSNTGNTFIGNITLPATSGTNDFINFASIGDGGSIIFGRASWLANVRYTGAANLEWNNRNIALATTFGITSGFDGGGNPAHMFENNGAGTVTINTAMQMTSTATSGYFFLGGNNTGNNTFAGAIADPTGANTLGIGKSGTGKWILSNNTNSFEGNVLLLDGTLSVGVIDVAANAQVLGKGSIIQLGYRTANIGTLEYTGSANAVTDKQIQLGQLSNSTNSNFAGGGVIRNNGDGTLTFSNTTFNSIAGVPGTGTGINRTLTLGGTNTGANTISGTIQDNSTAIGARLLLTKTGAGTWVLSGDNTFSGNVTVDNGVLAIQHTNALGANTKTVTVAGNNGTSLIPEMQLSGGISPTIASLITSGAGAAGTTGVINNLSGSNTLNVTGNISLIGGNGGSTFYSTAGDLTINATQIAANAATRTLTLAGPGNGVINAPIANGTTVDMPLIKTGAGIWTLTSTSNSYTGATTVSGGTFRLGASGVLPDATNVAIATATLDVPAGVIESIGTVTPGTGTLHVTAAATINLGDGTSQLAFANSSAVDWTGGTLNITGTFVSGSSLRFGTDNTGLTAGQLLQISATGFSNFGLDANGYLTADTGGGSPEIDVNQGGDIASGGSKDFGTVTLGSNTSLVFTINNTGTAALSLTGTPLVAVSGANAADFTVTALPASSVAASGNTTFTVQFAPAGAGARSAVLTIANNDSTEGTFTINVSGTGQTPYEAWASGAAFDADANGDGVKNGLAFLLGAANPSASALGLLPTVTQSGGNLTMTFSMLNAASRGNASLSVEHSSNLGISDPWTAVTVPDASGGPTSGVTFTVTPGSPNNSVTATVSSGEAASGKLFGRLKANP